MTAVILRCGCRVGIIDLSVPVSRVPQRVGHSAPVVLTRLRTVVVQRDRLLCHNHGGAPLKSRRRFQRAVGKP